MRRQTIAALVFLTSCTTSDRAAAQDIFCKQTPPRVEIEVTGSTGRFVIEETEALDLYPARAAFLSMGGEVVLTCRRKIEAATPCVVEWADPEGIFDDSALRAAATRSLPVTRGETSKLRFRFEVHEAGRYCPQI